MNRIRNNSIQDWSVKQAANKSICAIGADE